MPFSFEPQEIPEVLLVVPTLYEDSRGSFMETYRESEFQDAGVGPFVQDNSARSRSGVLRGLHFQLPPAPQAKLVRCVSWRVFDVAVDVRSGSPTFGQWVSVILDELNRHMLYVPAGFAHGYCASGGPAEVAYKVSAEYEPELSGGIRWDDPELDISWPVAAPVLSDIDRALPTLAEAHVPFTLSSQRPR